MKSVSLQHDCAYALAVALLGIVENLLRDEERRDCFEALYTASKAAIEAYEERAERMERRLRPSRN